MSSVSRLRLSLEDLLGDLHHARKTGDLGRVALLVYCELRRWARHADMPALAERANTLFLGAPYVDRNSFVASVDALIAEAERALASLPGFDAVPGSADTLHGRADPSGAIGR